LQLYDPVEYPVMIASGHGSGGEISIAVAIVAIVNVFAPFDAP